MKSKIKKKTGKKRLGYGRPLLKRKGIRKVKSRKRELIRRKRMLRHSRKRRLLRHQQQVPTPDFTVPVEAPPAPAPTPAPAPVINPPAVAAAPDVMLPHDATAFNKGYEDAYQEGFNQGFSKGYEEGSSLANQA